MPAAMLKVDILNVSKEMRLWEQKDSNKVHEREGNLCSIITYSLVNCNL